MADSRAFLNSRFRACMLALEHLVGGLGTALLALMLLAWLIFVAVASLAGVGLLFLPSTLAGVRAVADRERARLSRWGPREILSPGPLPEGIRPLLRDPGVHREAGWLAVHGILGLFCGIAALSLPLYALQDLTFPLWWQLLPPGSGGPGFHTGVIDDMGDALVVGLTGIGWLVVTVAAMPVLARLQAWPGRVLLPDTSGSDLSVRVAELTATRAAALDAHAAELRRIERSLHDGTQNRLVAVTVMLGAARRAVTRDPEAAVAAMDRAQDAAEQALAELRTVVRSILPPVLADRGLAGALSGLAGNSGVPCRLDLDVPGRCAASVEATAYYVVAEALTNVARHSGATGVVVTVRSAGDKLRISVTDDGKGGADETDGSGLSGIRRRVEAYDGSLLLRSPAGGPTTMEVELPCGS